MSTDNPELLLLEDQRAYAVRIHGLVTTLNRAVQLAAEAGLVVSLDVRTLHVRGEPARPVADASVVLPL